jgi:glycosyltransferase involved in cell wall biosynthesis
VSLRRKSDLANDAKNAVRATDDEFHYGVELKFSIVIPVFNRPRELRRALESCLRQTYSNIEVIVIDDCSTEDVQSVCTEFEDSRLKYARNATNSGASESRNFGMSLATGDYVCFLDSDDILLPEKLRVVHQAIINSAADIIIHKQYRVFDNDHGRAIHEFMPRTPLRQGDSIAEYIFRDGNFIQTNTFTLRRSIVEGRRFEKKYCLWDDTQFIIDCCASTRSIVYLDEPLAIFFDLLDHSRISQTRDMNQHAEMLAYLEQNGLKDAKIYFQALAVSDAIFYQKPFQSLGYVWHGFLRGVSAKRSLFYLGRCLLGFGRMKALVTFMRKLRPLGTWHNDGEASNGPMTPFFIAPLIESDDRKMR